MMLAWVGRPTKVQTEVKTIVCSQFEMFGEELRGFFGMLSKVPADKTAKERDADFTLHRFHQIATPGNRGLRSSRRIRNACC